MKKTPRTRLYNIYVIELKPILLEKRRIAEANPGYCKREDRPLLYVGMTVHPAEIRFEQHCRGYKASRYTRSNCVRLRKDLFEHLSPMTYDEAGRMEVSFANELRKKGFAVWQA